MLNQIKFNFENEKEHNLRQVEDFVSRLNLLEYTSKAKELLNGFWNYFCCKNLLLLGIAE